MVPFYPNMVQCRNQYHKIVHLDILLGLFLKKKMTCRFQDFLAKTLKVSIDLCQLSARWNHLLVDIILVLSLSGGEPCHLYFHDIFPLHLQCICLVEKRWHIIASHREG